MRVTPSPRSAAISASSVIRMSPPATTKQTRTIARAARRRMTNHSPLADGRFIINPGSVGQPRDRDPRAAYLWYDPDAADRDVEARRVRHRVHAGKDSAAGLPERLARRLALGQ